MATSPNETSHLVPKRSRNGHCINSRPQSHVSGSHEYEEFFKDSIPCPTCRGLGRISKESEHELVALIPMKDNRLKPRRTVLYVILSVVACILVASLILFFLYPRDVSVATNLQHLQPVSIIVNKSKSFANLTILNMYNISNSNYFPVEVTGVKMISTYDNKQITMVTNTTILKLPTRGLATYYVTMNFIFEKENDWDFLVKFCEDPRPWVHNLPITFQLTSNYSYLGHIEQTTLTTFQPITCYTTNSTTIAPPTVTTTTTTTTQHPATISTSKHSATIATSKHPATVSTSSL